MFKNIKHFSFKRKPENISRKELERRVEEGTRFAIKEYGDVLKALAKFDKAAN